MGKIEKNNLGYLGVDFQYRLINTFVEDPGFFRDLHSVIDQNMFTDPYLRTIVGVMKEYYTKQESVPSYDMISIKLNEKITNEDDRQYYTETMDKIRRMPTDGYREIEDMSEKFFFQQNLIKVSNELKNVASGGDISKYDECRKLLEGALAVGRKSDNTSTPFQSIEDDLSFENITTIPTGIERLDEGLGGGLDKGKIGLIICAMGVGKTSLTTCIAANAATTLTKNNNFEGYKVLQICFEDKPRDLHRKYISKVTQVETAKLNSNEDVTQRVKSLLKCSPDTDLINNNVKILKLNTGEVTATDIKNIIKKKANEGFRADLVIIDYFECIEPEIGTSRDDVTTREGKTMRKFETMAEELNIAMWIPTQGNRDSISAELVTNDKVGGSIRKNQIAQVVLSVTRSVDDIRNKRAALTILKNRSGGAGLVLNGVYFDNGTCTVTTDNVVDFEDAFSYNEHAKVIEDDKNKARIKEARANIMEAKRQNEVDDECPMPF